MVKDSYQATEEFVAWQKIAGLQIFSTSSFPLTLYKGKTAVMKELTRRHVIKEEK